MTLPNWKAIPVRTKRSRRRLHNLIADEFNLDSWTELPNPIKRSKKKLFNYYAEELHLEEFKELLKKDVRSTREYYNYLKENANPASAPTLTITVKSNDSAVSGASVTIGETTKSTGSDGKTTFTLDYDDYLVEVSKSGYIDYEENIKFRANHKSFTLNIEAEPSQSGTVTVTCQNSEQTTLPANVSIEEGTYGRPDYKLWGVGVAGADGTCVLKVPDEEGLPTEEVAEIPYGTYTLSAGYDDGEVGYFYIDEAFVIDGDETATITLTTEEQQGGK